MLLMTTDELFPEASFSAVARLASRALASSRDGLQGGGVVRAPAGTAAGRTQALRVFSVVMKPPEDNPIRPQHKSLGAGVKQASAAIREPVLSRHSLFRWPSPPKL